MSDERRLDFVDEPEDLTGQAGKQLGMGER